MGLQFGVVLEANGEGLEQAEALNDSLLELFGTGKAQGCWGGGLAWLQRLAGGAIRLQQAAGYRCGDGFARWNSLGVGGDQGIQHPQLLIQRFPAAL